MDKNFYLIKKKIEEIGSAIVYSHSNGEMKFSTQIITTLKVDDGVIWFMIPQSDFNTTCEKSFPVQLDYYRKGKPFHLKVYGKANLLPREEELSCLTDFSEEMKAMLSFKMILVRVNVLSIDLYNYPNKEKRGWLNRVGDYLYKGMFPASVHETFYIPGVQ